MNNAKAEIISRLKTDILKWQGFVPPVADEAKGIGLGPLEASFPNGVFPVGAIHEMLCPTAEQAAATGGFLTGILSAMMMKGGACLWIGTNRKIFPPSLNYFETAADRLIFVDVNHEKDVLWATEEALKCEGLAAVVAEVREISFAQSRRLQLAVESSRVTGFILRNDLRKLTSTVCVARWQVKPLPSKTEDELPGVGFPRWQVELLRVKNGNPGTWQLEWFEGRFMPVDEQFNTIPSHERKAG
ncbi:ImuA family protein [Mucilaginibacter lacusdianchii]|uniref:ImuA family protein n=1 Tax=Mucilaginibacter lacusdianchii TaxID=2684211 RepID=UPI00131ECF28|nr:Error-prone repair protein ImuA [Mucilaginibacter sp. JXJ CY 39]